MVIQMPSEAKAMTGAASGKAIIAHIRSNSRFGVR